MATSNWRTNLVVVGSVIFTVMVGLLLSQFDYLELRLLPTAQPVAGKGLITEATSTPLPVPHPSATPVPTATETAVPSATPEEVVSVVLQTCDYPANWRQYIVQPGDSLNSLALKNGTTAEMIRQANCLSVEFVTPGTRIYLPTVAIQPPTCIIPAGWRLYIVQPGDTMFRLALNRGVAVYRVLDVNCLGGTSLTAGQQIFLPPLLVPPALPTASLMPSLTATVTASPATETPTLVASGTPDVTVTPSLTVTLTSVPTSTVTMTPTATLTVTATATPTFDPSGTPTFTPTIQPTGLITTTPTIQPTQTTTVTTPIGTVTSTPTPGPTEAPTAVFTPTATVMPTETWTPLPTDTPVAVPTETAVPADTAVPTETPTS